MRKLKSKWLMALVGGVLLVALLAACGGEDTDAEPNENNNEAAENNANNNANDNEANDNEANDNGEAAANGDISGDLEIQYFVGGYGDEWWKEMIDGFTDQYPDVNVIEHAGPNINEEMRGRWVSNDPPDVVYIDGAGSSETQMIEDGQLMDLTEWAEELTLADGSSVLDNLIVEEDRHDGNIYTLPLVFDAWGTWYDRAWFDQEGFEVPTDFESWMDSMTEIKEQEGIEPFTTTGEFPYYFLRGVLYPAFASAGGDELLADLVQGAEGAWTSDEVVEIMEKVQRMEEEGMIDDGYAALNHTQSQMNFLLGDNAYIPVGFWLPNEMEGDIPEGFEFGFIPSPMNDPGEPYRIVPDLRPLAVAEEAENPEAAKAFIDYVFEREHAELFSEYTGALMNIEGVDLDANENVPQYLIDANEMINDPDIVQLNSLPHPMSADLETPISDALVSLMTGSIDAQEFVERAEEAAADYRD